jgi:hypothetical protein
MRAERQLIKSSRRFHGGVTGAAALLPYAAIRAADPDPAASGATPVSGRGHRTVRDFRRRMVEAAGNVNGAPKRSAFGLFHPAKSGSLSRVH